MKTNFALFTACAFLLGASTMPATLRAADVISPAETSTTGTISKIDAARHTLTLKFETGTETRYQLTKITRLFDAAGSPLALENLRPGIRLTVSFKKEGEDLVISVASIGQPAPAVQSSAPVAQNSTPAPQNPTPAPNPSPSLPADANGVAQRSLIMEVLPDTSTITVKSDTGASIRYRFTKNTQMMDEAGNMVTLDSIRIGTRATLQFTRMENELVLTRIIVIEPGPVITPQQAAVSPALIK